jgi:hypothetical protein
MEKFNPNLAMLFRVWYIYVWCQSHTSVDLCAGAEAIQPHTKMMQAEGIKPN